MNKKMFSAILPYTLPVMAGYITLGIAFGLLLQSSGYGPLWAFFMSLFVFAGSAQFLIVELLVAGASLMQTALLILILNFRHFFYGISMVAKYKGTHKKWYLIFGLTDETFAILSSQNPPEGIDKNTFYFWVTLLNQSYWVLGSVIGATIGSLITINMTGLDFSMTALFAVLVVEQWKNNKDHRPALIGFAITIACLYVLGSANFLIPALIIITGLLLVFRKQFDDPERMAKK